MRALNSVLKPDHYTFPLMADIHDDPSRFQHFFIMDLLDPLHQLELIKRASDLCTFSSPFGSYKFLVLPQGVRNSPSCMQRFVNGLFLPLYYASDCANLRTYIDDFIGGSEAGHGDTSFDHRHRLLRDTLRIAQKNGLRFSAKKSTIFAEIYHNGTSLAS